MAFGTLIFLVWQDVTSQVELVHTLSSSDNWVYSKFPLKATDFVEYTSPFGPRNGAMHSGIDIAVDLNKPVLAWWDGEVIDTVTEDPGGCGKEVFIKAGRWDYRYCHLNKVLVQKGQKVKAGDTVGLSGSTGHSSGPHLHWETRFNESLIDPARVIKAMKKSDAALSATPSSYINYKILRYRDEKCTDCLR
jgi:murein DD-endopeptidase MepM/ murein hydrolase activator NlpD